MLGEGEGLLLVDCRTDEEVAICAIAGSMHVGMEHIVHASEDIADEAGDRRVVVYCHHGVRSLTAAAFLREQGIDDALSMRGGIDAWSRTIDPAIPTY